jgi:hypothetical protein
MFTHVQQTTCVYVQLLERKFLEERVHKHPRANSGSSMLRPPVKLQIEIALCCTCYILVPSQCLYLLPYHYATNGIMYTLCLS